MSAPNGVAEVNRQGREKSDSTRVAWLFGLGQMHGDMSQREERRGFGAREPLASIYGVELTPEQASTYRVGFERGAW